MNCEACGQQNVPMTHIFDCKKVKGLVEEAKAQTRVKTPEEVQKEAEAVELLKKNGYHCAECLARFETREAIIAHRVTVHNVKQDHALYDAQTHNCHRCSTRYPTLEALNIHIDREHNKPKVVKEDEDKNIEGAELAHAKTLVKELFDYLHRYKNHRRNADFILKPNTQSFIVDMMNNFRRYSTRTLVSRKQYNWLKRSMELITTHRDPL